MKRINSGWPTTHPESILANQGISRLFRPSSRTLPSAEPRCRLADYLLKQSGRHIFLLRWRQHLPANPSIPPHSVSRRESLLGGESPFWPLRLVDRHFSPVLWEYWRRNQMPSSRPSLRLAAETVVCLAKTGRAYAAVLE